MKKKKKKSAKKQPVEQQSVNKENVQATTTPVASQRSQIQSNNKQTSNKIINSGQFYKDRFNYTKLQEKCKYYVKNVNLKQRKYHNLQQPQYLNVNFVNIRN
jgi:hypothetical protein